MNVGAGIRLGDRKRHLQGAVGEAGQPPLALLGRPGASDDGGRNGRGDHDEQQRAAARGQLLADDGQLGDAGSAAAELLRHRHPEEPGLTGLGPQLGGLGTRAGLGKEVVVAVTPGQRRHRFAQHQLLVALREVHHASLGRIQRTRPGSELWPHPHRLHTI